MRPYSLAHSIILRAKGSPYLADAPSAQRDLFFALQICARTLTQCKQRLLGPHLPIWQLFLSGLRWRRASFATADASFRVYLADYRRYPERQPSDTKSDIVAPFEWHAARVLCREYGFNLDNVWDTPINVAVCAVEAWQESRGVKGLMSQYDAALNDLMTRQTEYEKAGNATMAEYCGAEIVKLIQSHGGE